MRLISDGKRLIDDPGVGDGHPNQEFATTTGAVALAAMSLLLLAAPSLAGRASELRSRRAIPSTLRSAGRRSLPVKLADPADLVALDQLQADLRHHI